VELALRILVMGVTATVAIDLWATFANRLLGWPRTNWALVGRWIGHMRDGQFTHASIGSSPTILHESILGWVFHYVVGCLYAALYLMYVSAAQMEQPTLVSAVLFGWVASKVPRANLVRLQNLLIHTIFGLALYLSYQVSNALA
jgi:DUF2938 family protein